MDSKPDFLPLPPVDNWHGGRKVKPGMPGKDRKVVNMGIFDKKTSSDTIREIENRAEEKYKGLRGLLKADGSTHAIMITVTVMLYDSENEYTPYVDKILSLMQKDGYHILDVRFQRRDLHGAKLTNDVFHTLITYAGA